MNLGADFSQLNPNPGSHEPQLNLVFFTHICGFTSTINSAFSFCFMLLFSIWLRVYTEQLGMVVSGPIIVLVHVIYLFYI